jgi:nucleoid-associated protein Lsr2
MRCRLLWAILARTFRISITSQRVLEHMAQKVHIVLEDDLDGSEATQTVQFGLDGTSYEIDLNDKNAAKLRDAMATYVGHGRKVTGARRGRRSAASSSSGASAKEIRDWARSNGHQVPERGRIPSGVREAFEASH